VVVGWWLGEHMALMAGGGWLVVGRAYGALMAGGGWLVSEGKQIGVLRDVIQGTPVMCQIYDGGSLSLTASSGVLSSQNLGHAQAMDILSGRSRRQ